MSEVVPTGLDPVTKKFLPGNQMARGRSKPHAAVVAELRRDMIQYATDHSIVQKLLQRADELLDHSNPKVQAEAIRFWSSYLFGKPEQTINLDVTAETRNQTMAVDLTPEKIEVLRQVRDWLTPPAISHQINQDD